MDQTEYNSLVKRIHYCEEHPDETLFLMDISPEGSPYVSVPLGEDQEKDGCLVIHPGGWFIHKGK